MQCMNCGRKVYANEKCVCGEKAPKKNNAGVLINTIICFVLLIPMVFSLIINLSLRTIIDSDLIVNTIEDVELAELKIDDRNLDQYIYDKYINDERVKVNNVRNLLEEDFIKDFVVDIVKDYQGYLLGDNDMPYITSDDIIKLIEDNEDVIYKEIGLRFLAQDKKELRNQLEKLDSFEDDTNDFFNTTFGALTARTMFSYVNVIALSALIAAIFVEWLIVYILNQRRAAKMIYKYGIAVFVPSLIVFVSAVLEKIILNFDIADKLIDPLVTPFLIFSASTLALGIIIFVIGIIMNSSYKASRAVGEVEFIEQDNTLPENSSFAPEQPNFSTNQQDSQTEQSNSPVNQQDSQIEQPNAPVNQQDSKPEQLNPPLNQQDVQTEQPNAPVNQYVQPEQPNPTVNNEDGKKTCPNCSFNNIEKASFCSRCGTKLNK